MNKNIIFSVHSMDTSFYALYNNTLVEFQTGENGIVPYGYPTHTKIYNKIFGIVRASGNIPSIKQKLESLVAKYKQLYERGSKGKNPFRWENLLSWQATDIMKDFIYIYKGDARDTASGTDKFLRGEVDEFNNIYRYNLANKPMAPLPPGLTRNICVKLSFLPQVKLRPAIIFSRLEVKDLYSSTNPNIDLISVAVQKVTNSKRWKDNFLALPYRRQIEEVDEPLIILVDLRKIGPHQKTALALAHPSFVRHPQRSEILLFPALVPYLDNVDHMMAIGHVRKISPQSVRYIGYSPQLVALLQKSYQEAERKEQNR